MTVLRHILTFLAIASLLSGVIIVGWSLSHLDDHDVLIPHHPEPEAWHLTWRVDQTIWVFSNRRMSFGGPRFEPSPQAPKLTLEFAGFEMQYGPCDEGSTFVFLRIHLWWIALILFALPLLYVARWFRRRVTTSKHQCLKCGYDLHASRECCPEHGTTFECSSKVTTPA